MARQFTIAQHCPHRVALQTNEECVHYALLQERVNALTEKIKPLSNSTLVLTANPSIEFVTQCLACLKTGRPVAIFPPSLIEDERDTHLAMLGNAMIIREGGEIWEVKQKVNKSLHPDAALLLLTSGSQGQPKVVQLSLQNILANCDAVIQSLQLNHVKDQVLFLPLSYSFGLLGQLLPGLMSGISTRLISQFMEVKNLLETEKVPEMWSGVPSHWVAISKMGALYKIGAEKIQAIVSAGAPLSVQLRAELLGRFPNAIVYNNYGLTEASPRVLSYSSQDPRFLENYAGYPVGDWEIKLSKQHELLVRGSQVMLGYLGEEINTKVQDGWLSTGDVADILPNGLVAIKGRLDNVVNIGGEKMTTTDIEQAICQIESIKEAVVLPIDDDIYGTRLILYIEKSTLSNFRDSQHLTETVMRQLLPKKPPLTFRFLDSFPRNRNGKLNRNDLIRQELEHAKKSD
ncbi:class I adenylate-forming enzyme family protein [Legionella waltersii]|uniref:Acyl CoA ligase n=1 Tax=Legionella waltersii TaxID=66969 RepID=A0A0W0ZZU9_9GAMM|nr:class I adenylate-forming enzyme family protein [Legionella waltersii]KTD74621.1 acyl CoA ligase [Legionella waltersii]SNV08850.1 acyl CoA ligase [Legionella waltersii]